ncbi:toxin-antitoxin system YwqK family antitoxin [Tenacibaculum sp. UWU-22]|uniref:toxin-antitoxin system YwqK family antitoxin n=1 Tax=Tenacibaculum sp. UWU-22 TaxID=3234187 RepID=UPI0034DB5771
MKKLFGLICILSISFVQAQKIEPTYEKSQDLVKATYYYSNRNIREQGFFKNKKLTGTWTSFDEKGNKTAIAHYKDGKKTGKWFLWQGKMLNEINYKNNTIASVQIWKEGSKITLK